MQRMFRLAVLPALIALVALVGIAGAPVARADTPPGVTTPNPGATWTPPAEPKLVAVRATSCPDDPTATMATCLTDVDGTVPDQTAAAVGKADAVASSDTATAPAPDNAVPQALSKSGAYSPQDLASLYQIPSSVTSKATVGIVDVGHDPNTRAQLDYYRSYFGLPACTPENGCFREVGQSGGSSLPPPNSAWVNEIALDVQAVSAICPSCHILLVDAKSASADDLGAGAATAVRLGASYLSLSYGSADSVGNAALNLSYYNSPGVTYVAATGDNGYAGGTIFPSSATNVIAAGGTSARLVNGTWRQSAWSGGGSGCSSTSVLGLVGGLIGTVLASSGSTCPGGRPVSDVSALADADTGIMFYRGGSWLSGGGTSLAAPIVASLYALAGNHTTPRSIYDNAATKPSSFADITSGANGSCGTALCTAGPGWDGPTGVGTPAGLSGLVATGAPAAPLAAPTTAGALARSGSGYPARLSYRLADAVTGAPVANAPVLVQANSGSGFRSVGVAHTDGAGAVLYSARPRGSATYRVFYGGDATHAASTSPAVAVRTFAPKVKVKAEAHTVRVVAKAPWGKPAAKLKVRLQRRSGRHWSAVKAKGKTNAKGRITLRAAKPGRYRATYGNGQWAPGATKAVKVR